VLSPPKTHSATGDFALATVVAEVSLLPANIRIAAGRKPVALAVGFLDPPPPVSTRNQVRIPALIDISRYVLTHVGFVRNHKSTEAALVEYGMKLENRLPQMSPGFR
jgi:hypothetical protein